MKHQKIMELIKKIPKGKVTTYKEIASFFDSKGYRAVGQALKKNQKPIEIPCHRIVKSDGSLGGYASKLNNKQKELLLKKECVKFIGKKIDMEKCFFRFT